eukprot:2625280-Alexandrium_andersonii.AAC.1
MIRRRIHDRANTRAPRRRGRADGAPPGPAREVACVQDGSRRVVMPREPHQAAVEEATPLPARSVGGSPAAPGAVAPVLVGRRENQTRYREDVCQVRAARKLM